MILDLNPGTAREYPIFGAVLTGPDGKDLSAPTIMSPIRNRVEGLIIYLIAYGSCAWHIYVSDHLRDLKGAEHETRPDSVRLVCILQRYLF